MEIVSYGELMNLYVIVMTYPHSNATVAVPLQSEKQECFLQGLKCLFTQSEEF